MNRPSYVPAFDSATGLQTALNQRLASRPLKLMGLAPGWLEPLARPVTAIGDRLPFWLRERIWGYAGWLEGLPGDQTGRIDPEEVFSAFAAAIPARRYPAVMIGSANGALMHLAAAMAVPWLPQTFLVPVRHPGLDPDDPRAALEWAKGPAARVLERHPDLVLHQMHDPSQDRPMLRHISLFRFKRRILGAAYRAFLDRSLAPGGTIVVVGCRCTWPAASVSQRHWFQFGGAGALTAAGYHEGDPRIEGFLRAQRAARRSWQPPEPDAEVAEGEWGFDEALLDDILAYADERGLRVRRLSFTEPDAPSAAVADLHRDWYRRLGRRTDRLLVDSFLVTEPYWTLRTASVPFWLVFNTQRSADQLERYLRHADPWEEIRLLLIQHGTRSLGLAPMERWHELLARARSNGSALALRGASHPASPSLYANYERELARLEGRLPLPPPLEVDALDALPALSGGLLDVEDARPITPSATPRERLRGVVT